MAKEKMVRFKVNAARTDTPVKVTVNGVTKTIPNNVEVELPEAFYNIAAESGYDVTLIKGDPDGATDHKAVEETTDPTLSASGDTVVVAATDSEDAATVAELPQGAADANAPDAGGGNSDGVQKFDHDGDGKAGGSEPQEPVTLAGKTTAQLEEIAKAEGVDLTDAATNKERAKLIEDARAEAGA